jgi:hypothetical protein
MKKNSMISGLLAALLCADTMSGARATEAPATKSARTQIEQVVARFQSAIIGHDKAG